MCNNSKYFGLSHEYFNYSTFPTLYSKLNMQYILDIDVNNYNKLFKSLQYVKNVTHLKISTYKLDNFNYLPFNLKYFNINWHDSKTNNYDYLPNQLTEIWGTSLLYILKIDKLPITLSVLYMYYKIILSHNLPIFLNHILVSQYVHNYFHYFNILKIIYPFINIKSYNFINNDWINTT